MHHAINPRHTTLLWRNLNNFHASRTVIRIDFYGLKLSPNWRHHRATLNLLFYSPLQTVSPHNPHLPSAFSQLLLGSMRDITESSTHNLTTHDDYQPAKRAAFSLVKQSSEITTTANCGTTVTATTTGTRFIKYYIYNMLLAIIMNFSSLVSLQHMTNMQNSNLELGFITT